MALTGVQIAIIKDFFDAGEKDSTLFYQKYFPKAKLTSARASASALLSRKESKDLIDKLRTAKEQAAIAAVGKAWEKLYAEEVATEAEIDIFHTAVMRGKVEIEEVFPVKEYEYVEKAGVRFKTGRVITVFKKIKRQPTIRERQVSAAELYRRKGSYKQPAKLSAGQDDQEAAEKSKLGHGGEDVVIQRTVVLSSGKEIPLP